MPKRTEARRVRRECDSDPQAGTSPVPKAGAGLASSAYGEISLCGRRSGLLEDLGME
jgi:hypothetical protein